MITLGNVESVEVSMDERRFKGERGESGTEVVYNKDGDVIMSGLELANEFLSPKNDLELSSRE